MPKTLIDDVEKSKKNNFLIFCSEISHKSVSKEDIKKLVFFFKNKGYDVDTFYPSNDSDVTYLSFYFFKRKNVHKVNYDDCEEHDSTEHDNCEEHDSTEHDNCEEQETTEHDNCEEQETIEHDDCEGIDITLHNTILVNIPMSN